MASKRSPEKEIQRLLAHIKALEAERDRLKQRDLDYQLIFDRVSDRLASARARQGHDPERFEGISFVIVYYDIPRQIERTLQSCSPAYQGMTEGEIEVVLIDNGSPTPLPDDLQQRFPHVRQILRIEDEPSPVAAVPGTIQVR